MASAHVPTPFGPEPRKVIPFAAAGSHRLSTLDFEVADKRAVCVMSAAVSALEGRQLLARASPAAHAAV